MTMRTPGPAATAGRNSPTGGEIQGTSETILAASAVTFDTDNACGYDHSGGSEVWWDTSTTDTIDGVPLFTDDSGDDWLQHHLIPEGTEALPCLLIAGMREEMRIGRLLESLKRTRDQFRALIDGGSTFVPQGYGGHEATVDRLNNEIAMLENFYRTVRDQVMKEVAMTVTEEEDA